MRTIKCIPAFNDNYIWLIVDDNQQCCVVDPGDASPVIDVIEQHSLILRQIWLTHHHADHTGGVEQLVSRYPNLEVFGPAHTNIPHPTHVVKEGDVVSFSGIDYQVMALPGHTLEHIAYWGDDCLFCGDVLFSAGCGRVFEGTYQQMYDSLMRIKGLPVDTYIYPAHEYTLANVEFAITADPDNEELIRYHQQVITDRSNNKATLPTTLQQQIKVNPFLRSEELVSQAWAVTEQLTTPVAIFAYLRDWKNRF